MEAFLTFDDPSLNNFNEFKEYIEKNEEWIDDFQIEIDKLEEDEIL